jgi:hypothetical protein
VKVSRARHHGRTFCKRCCKKIAFGMTFCNAECRRIYTYGYGDAAEADKARDARGKALAALIDATINELAADA